MSTDRERILVGLDGSPASLRALRWAARQAELTGARLTAVIAWHFPVMYGSEVGTADFNPEQTARDILDRDVGLVRREFPRIRITASIWPGWPGEVLVREAKAADLLVVGARGHGLLSRSLLGSTSMHCVAHADCSVMVVR